MRVLFDNRHVLVEEACYIVTIFLAAFGSPVAVICNINVLAFFVKQHTAICPKCPDGIVVLIFAHVGIGQAIMECSRSNLRHRVYTLALFVNCKRTDERTVLDRQCTVILDKCMGLQLSGGHCAVLSPCTPKRHTVKRHRAALHNNSVGGTGEHLSAAGFNAESIMQNTVLNDNIRRTSDGKHLICNLTADGLAVQIKGEFAVLGNNAVFHRVKSYIAQQFQG